MPWDGKSPPTPQAGEAFALYRDGDHWIAALVDADKQQIRWNVRVEAGNVLAVMSVMDGAGTLDAPVRPCCTPPNPITPPKQGHVWIVYPDDRERTTSRIAACVNPRPEILRPDTR